MANRSDRLLKEIEAGALDSKTSIGDLLRKVIALGGQAGSTELSDWAARELKGYGPDDELPPYRRISAPLQIDAGTMHGFIKGQMISRWDLPDFAQDKITNDLELRQSVAEIEQLARSCPPGEVVKLQPFMSQELVHYMNATQKWSGRVERMYWSIAPTTLDGVVDQVRTTLTTLVAEINATMPEGMTVPPAEVANNAFNLAVTGKRNKISVATPQSGQHGDDGSSGGTTQVATDCSSHPRRPRRNRRRVLRHHGSTELELLRGIPGVNREPVRDT